MSSNALHRLTSARAGIEKLLHAAQAEVMGILWAHGPLTVRTIHRVIAAQRDIAYTTTMTTCVRLAEKGLLNREKVGQRYVYTPAIGERAFVGDAVAEILDAVVKDYPAALTLYLDARREVAAQGWR